MNSLTEDSVIDSLIKFLSPIIGECRRGQLDRVPPPQHQFCVLTPISISALTPPRSIKLDTGDPATSSVGFTEVRLYRIQLDIYGEGAGDRANSAHVLFNSEYGYDGVQEIDERVHPVRCSAIRQMPSVSPERQWWERYSLDLFVQAEIITTVREDYFDRIEFTTEAVK